MQSFYKDWSGTSPRPDWTTELVKSSLEHPGGLTKQSCPQDQTGRTIENPAAMHIFTLKFNFYQYILSKKKKKATDCSSLYSEQSVSFF